MASIQPVAKQQYFNPTSGRPLAGGLLYTYAAGTSTPKQTYQDQAGTIPWSNPITLDATGSALIYWSGSYKVVLKDALGNTVYTVDNYITDQATSLQQSLLASSGSSLVGFIQSAAGAVAQTVQGVLRETLTVTNFGAVNDGVTDNTAAFTALATYVNSIPLTSLPVSIKFPRGVYKYAGGLNFTRPVNLRGDGWETTLNYTGNAEAIKLGPDGVTGFNVFIQREYTVDGLRMTGGASATFGIYINEHIIEPRIYDVIFEDFGNSASYDIYAQFENWDTIIQGCRKIVVNSVSATGNFIAIPGRKKDNSAYDGGNSRVSIIDCFMSSFAGQQLGFFAYVNAVKARIIGGGFQHSTGGIIVGGNASSTLIDGVYAELSTTSSPWYVQAVSIDVGGGNFSSPQQVTIRNGYINMHQDVITNTGRMIKAADTNVKIRDWVVDGMTISNYANGQVLIEQNNLAGQTGNQYSNIKRYYNPASSDDGKRFVLRGGYSLAEKWTAADSDSGLWTPSLGGTATYTTQTGKYVRNGNLVTITFDLQVNAIGTGNTSQISGIPFTNTGNTCAGSIGFYNSLATSVVSLNSRIDAGTSFVQITGQGAAAASIPGSLAVFGNAARVVGTVSYMVEEPI